MSPWREIGRSGDLLDGFFGVAPRDRRDAAVGFVTLFLAMSAHSMMEAARDTLFLQALPATRLPWAYLAIAALTLLGSTIQRRLLVGVSRRGTLRATLLVGAAVTLSLALVPSLPSSEAALLAFYTWTGLLATTIVVQFWLLAGSVMDFGQAKRAFALLGAGGLLGALSGSIAAASTLTVARAQTLPLVASSLFALASFVPRYFSPDRVAVARHAGSGPERGARSQDQGYFRRVFALVLLGTITVTLVDYLFKSTVAREVPRERLGEFFSRYYAVINAAALGLELLVAPRLLRAAGVQRLVLVMPALLLLTSLGFATAGTLVAVLLLRGADGSLRHSMNRVGVELLHLPLDVDSRARFRTLSEAGGLRVGQALASVLVLIAVGFGLAGTVLPWAPVVLSLLWLGIALRLERFYVGRLRQGIETRSKRTNVPEPEFDRASRRALKRALRGSEGTEVLAALDAVLARERSDLIPVSVLDHPSSKVVLKALEAKWDSSRSAVASRILRLLSHPNAELRAAALRQHIAHGARADVLERCAEDESSQVRVTALVGLARLDTKNESWAAEELERILAGNDAFALRALARAAGLLPARRCRALSLRIADGPDDAAAALLSEAIAEAPDEAHLPALIVLLARREARASARKALVTLGSSALGALSQALEDPATPAAIRIHLPRTISRFHEPGAAAALQRAFVARPDDAVGFKILRALGRLRSDEPRLPLDRRLLESAALRTIERAVTTMCWRRAVEVAREYLPRADDACTELLSRALAEESGRALERTFRVMHILEPNCAFHVMFVATRSGDPDVRARGREMLEHLAPATLKRALLALLDDAPTSTRLQRPLGFRLPRECLRALRLVRPRGAPNPLFEREALATLAECLAHAARHPNPLLRSLAARHARTLELRRPGAIHAE